MENRRQTSATKSFSQKKYYDKNREGSSYQHGKYPNREGGDRVQRQEGNDRFQNRDNNTRNQPREGGERFQPREGGERFQPREGGERYQNRGSNDRFQPRENRGRFQPRQGGGDRFQSRDGGRDNRDQRDTREGVNRGPNKYFSKGYNKFQPNNRFSKDKGFKPWKKEDNIKIVSDMQVTDGKHKGKYLLSSASPNVVPTTRRIREAMFKILFRRVRAGRFLDLCAGAGTIGIEAISRGSIISTFVERSAKMCSFIKKNLETLAIKEGHGEVVEMEVLPFLKRMHKRRRQWDVVYYDPPNNSDYEEVLAFLGRGAAIKPKGILVVEHHAEMFFPEKAGVLKRWRVIVQGDTALSFYERS